MAEQSGHTQSSLINSELGTILNDQQQYEYPKTYRVSIILTILAFYYLAFGLTELITNYQQTTYTVALNCSHYKCTGETNFINFEDNQQISIYLVNQQITQNDISSQFEQQSDDLTSCSSYTTNSQGNKTISINGKELANNQTMLPCGRFVSLFPGNQFRILQTDGQTYITVHSDDLDVLGIQYEALDSDLAWLDVSSERFKVWNQRQAAPYLFKLWGECEQMGSGSYKIQLESQNPISPQISKSLKVLLTDNKALFGQNLPLCILNFIWSALLFGMGCFSCWKQQKIAKEAQYKNQQNFHIKSHPPIGVDNNVADY